MEPFAVAAAVTGLSPEGLLAAADVVGHVEPTAAAPAVVAAAAAAAAVADTPSAVAAALSKQLPGARAACLNVCVCMGGGMLWVWVGSWSVVYAAFVCFWVCVGVVCVHMDKLLQLCV